MDLWIRSQDRDELIKADNIYITTCNEGWAIRSGIILGKYRTRERALEILDEIQKKMVQTFLLKENEPIKRKEIDYLCSYYRRKEINVVEVPNGIELESINKDIMVYEMPEE